VIETTPIRSARYRTSVISATGGRLDLGNWDHVVTGRVGQLDELVVRNVPLSSTVLQSERLR